MFNFDICAFFALAAIYTALRVITTKNPVNSVLYLVLVFANITVLLFNYGVEYMGIILWIIYVGAIAILLLFVLKLLNIRLVELKDNSTRYFPVGLIIGFILYTTLIENVPSLAAISNGKELGLVQTVEFSAISAYTNLELLGLRLFEDLGFLLIIAGFILLLAMVGAIILTLGHEGEVRRQDIFEQVSR